VRVGNDELQAWYRSHQAEYTQEVHLQHIVVNTREDAEDVLDMLRGGASFEQLARQRSRDQSANRGGELGFLGKGAMNPAFEPFAFAASPGTITGPIATTFGFHIVKVLARRPSADPITFEAARDEIMHTLLLQKQQEAQAKLLQELRAAAQVQLASSYNGLSLTPDTTAAEPSMTQSFLPGGGRSASAPPAARSSPAAALAPDSLAADRD
jgi:foldase protein PrsA